MSSFRGRHPATIGYAGMHGRVHRVKGSASSYICECGAAAADWAYDHQDIDERFDVSTGSAFSTNVDRYQPMCKPCHRQFDVGQPLSTRCYPHPRRRAARIDGRAPDQIVGIVADRRADLISILERATERTATCAT